MIFFTEVQLEDKKQLNLYQYKDNSYKKKCRSTEIFNATRHKTAVCSAKNNFSPI